MYQEGLSTYSIEMSFPAQSVPLKRNKKELCCVNQLYCNNPFIGGPLNSEAILISEIQRASSPLLSPIKAHSI